jgi:hypothetical protein
MRSPQSAAMTTTIMQLRNMKPSQKRPPPPAAPLPPPVPGKPPPELEALLADSQLTTVLSAHGITSQSTPFTTMDSRVAVAAHFVRATGVPLPSDAFAGASSALDVAHWYAKDCAALRPPMPGPHAVRLVALAKETPEIADNAAQIAESEVRDAVARAGGVVEEQLLEEAGLPPNLQLDPRTF